MGPNKNGFQTTRMPCGLAAPSIRMTLRGAVVAAELEPEFDFRRLGRPNGGHDGGPLPLIATLRRETP